MNAVVHYYARKITTDREVTFLAEEDSSAATEIDREEWDRLGKPDRIQVIILPAEDRP